MGKPSFMPYTFNMELLSPAGNLEKLKTAIRFGADAVYCGAGPYSLRPEKNSFSPETLAEGVSFAHRQGCRVYLAINIFAFDQDFAGMEVYLESAEKAGIDAIILSDPGVLEFVRRTTPGTKIHLSTQANTTNSESARFWFNRGVSRIVAARELSLEQIAAIKTNVPDLELEILVHGAMCVAFSGRCLLSSIFNQRSANRGDCSQPCRWEYYLREAGRSEEQLIGEDGRGTYILNSKDLCLIKHIPELASAGVDSLKMEGRMKSTYYVAAVTRAYRAALDNLEAHDRPHCYNSNLFSELQKVSHRPYTTGFYFPDQGESRQCSGSSTPQRGYDFVGMVEGHDLTEGVLTIAARNRFVAGDWLEILDPRFPETLFLQVDQIKDALTGRNLAAAHNSYRVLVPCPELWQTPVSEGSILRRKIIE